MEGCLKWKFGKMPLIKNYDYAFLILNNLEFEVVKCMQILLWKGYRFFRPARINNLGGGVYQGLIT